MERSSSSLRASARWFRSRRRARSRPGSASQSKAGVHVRRTDKSRRPVFAGARFFVSILLAAGCLWLLLGAVSGLDGSRSVSAASDPVVAAAGDIACDPSSGSFNGGLGTSSNCRQKYTSDVLVNMSPSAVLDLGDNQYYCGGLQAFLQSYDLSWGRLKAITHPSIGNHEYLTSGGTGCDITNEGASGYFNYFGSAAGTAGQGYYSYDVGTWHLIVLNSNCTDAGGCGTSSPQYAWLQADLAAHTNFCTLAYWHIPLYSSGGRAASNSKSFWQLLYDNNADLILNGHDHIYERFSPQSPTGLFDTVRGLREFIVGTGGSDHTSITSIAANSELRNTDAFGVLKLTLHATSYDWQFVPETGKTFADSGTGACHSGTSDVTPPTAPSNLEATSVAWNQVSLSWTAATDNIGVAGYRVFRNGVLLATTPGSTAYSDTTVQPQTAYNYYVLAVDGVGLTSGSSNTISVTTPPLPTVLTFAPSADAYVESDVPTMNFGTSTQIVTDNSPVKQMLLKFTVSGVGAQKVLSAKLRLYCVDPSPFGGEFHRVADASWTEASVNWNNVPAADPNILATLNSVTAGTWYEVDVTPLVTGDGTFSLRALSSSSDGAYYSSKEGAAGFAPQLVVSPGSSSSTPTATSAATATPTSPSGPTSTPKAALTATNTPVASSAPTNTPVPATSTPTNTPLPTSTPTNSPTPTQVAPDTSITSGPSGSVNETSPSFGFTSTISGSSFMCSLDGSAFGSCTPPSSYTALPDGSHTFHVYAVSPGGVVDSTPSSRTWTIDTVAPTSVAITSPLDGATITGQVKLNASASDNGGVQSVGFYVDGKLLLSDSSAPFSATWNTKKVTKGTHTLYVTAVDAAGNVTQSATLTVTVN